MNNEGTSLPNYIGFLNYLANYLAVTRGVPVTTAKCPECGSQWSVWKNLCPSSADYECGYRSIWKCQNPDCSEMELR